ncbi:MAG: helix-turn-helix domain-containing protein [Cytophagales bacterium]|nr:MAG: helix-turn-helix domain-containing protein [Cytophagales bacterium]
MKKSFLFSVFFFFICKFIQAQIEPEFSLENKVSTYLADDSVSIDILNNKVNFTYPASLDESQVSRGNKWSWIKFNIENKSYLEQKKYLVIQNGLIENISFFQKNNLSNTLESSFHTGIVYPFYQRPIPNRQFTFPIILKPNSMYTIYLRGHINTGTLLMPLRIFNESQFDNYKIIHNGLSILTLAIWVFAMLIGLVLFILFKERLYYFYTVYIFLLMIFWACYEAISYEFIWPNSPFLANNSRNTYLLAGSFFAAFMISILGQSGNRMIKIKKYLKIISWIFLPLTVAISATAPYYYEWCTRLVIVGDILLVIIILMVLYTILLKLIERNEYSILAVISATPMILYVVIQFLSYYKVIYISRTGFYMQYGFGLCSIFEIIFLFLLLIYRFRRLVLTNIQSEQIIISPNIIQDYKEAVIIEKNSVSYSNSIYSNEELIEILQEIKTKIESQKCYIIQGLNLGKLSSIVNQPTHTISECINRIEKSNFNDFINKYRVEYAKEMLLDKKYDYLSVEGIGKEVGFSTKATFYASFKKFTNTSPKKYVTMQDDI